MTALRLSLAFAIACASTLALAADDDAKPSLVRMKYNNPGLVVDLGVGLWGWPLPVDYDDDGDLDLLVSCSDYPYNGVWFFENSSGKTDPSELVFKPGKKISKGLKNVGLSYVDGKPRVLTPNKEHPAFLSGDFAKSTPVKFDGKLKQLGAKIRANQWALADVDSDGAADLVIGQGSWEEYGWDNAFNEKGEWQNGRLHGYVYVGMNEGTNDAPQYANPKPLTTLAGPVDVEGMPSPNFADFDGDGDLDLLCGDFIDGFTYFQNLGKPGKPEFDAGMELMAQANKPLEMPLCMIVVNAIDWDDDGDVDLIVGQEDGRIAFIEHTGRVDFGMPIFKPPVFFQQEADEVKFGALVTPVSVDWDDDGDEDLICGNTAGEIGFIENLDGGSPPKWAAPKLLTARGGPNRTGDVIRVQAGENLSIQGPAERKWGYTTLDVADWDHDGDKDIVFNSIVGTMLWCENDGQPGAPSLIWPRPVPVEWSGAPPKPAWNWWTPKPRELAPQWRTTPLVVDWNKDGLNDLLSLDHEGYLAFFERAQQGDSLILKPGRRIFVGGTFDSRHRPQKLSGPSEQELFLHLNNGIAGRSGRRKLALVDYDADGDLDLLVNSDNISLLENLGPAEGGDDEIVWFADRGTLFSTRLAGHTTSPTTVDWNGDGKRDVLVGAEDGYFYITPEMAKPQAKQTSALDSEDRLNVLFIAVDDMRCDLACYGQSQIKSPHIDALAARGVLFENAHCQQTVCNPSRASLLTGLRPDTLGVVDLPTHFRTTRPDVVTLPQAFKRAGYQAHNIGKIFHNWVQDDFKGDAQSWSVPAVMHYAKHGDDKPLVAGELPESQTSVPKCERLDVPDEAYFDGRIAQLAVERLQSLSQQPQPFFLAVGFWKPHSPFNAPAKYWEMYDESDIELPSAAEWPADAPRIAWHNGRELTNGFKHRKGNQPNETETRTLRHGYYAAISYVDAQIGKVIDELDRLGLADNTVIVFWSDHGYHLGEHTLWAKTSTFELDARVPLIIAAPQQSRGKRCSAPVELLDLYPTLLDLCGLDVSHDLEGKSLTPLLSDPDRKTDRVALTQMTRPAYPDRKRGPEAMGYSLRSQRYRYTEWREVPTGRVLARELYDHESDPLETRNVIADEKASDAADRLRNRLAEVIGEPANASR